MVSYWYFRVRYTSACLSDVPSQYRAEVKAKLQAAGLNDCGN